MRALLLIVCALVLAACGGNRPDAVDDGGGATTTGAATADTTVAAASSTATPVVDESRSCTPGDELRVPDRRFSYALVAKRPVRAHSRPGGELLETFPRKTSLGAPNVFAIRRVVVDERCAPTWYRVQLPMRPNGSVGYVRARGVEPFRVATRIEIDLSKKRVVLTRRGRRLLAAPVAVGSSGTPTPTGTYYVNQKVRVTDRFGPYGPAALGISAFSPVLTGWAEGGPVAIHGTNDPTSIGKSISNGCVRVRNDQLLRLFDATPVGTPVVIRA